MRILFLLCLISLSSATIAQDTDSSFITNAEGVTLRGDLRANYPDSILYKANGTYYLVGKSRITDMYWRKNDEYLVLNTDVLDPIYPPNPYILPEKKLEQGGRSLLTGFAVFFVGTITNSIMIAATGPETNLIKPATIIMTGSSVIALGLTINGFTKIKNAGILMQAERNASQF